jgi:DNA-binding MarR family transcriptional regulator
LTPQAIQVHLRELIKNQLIQQTSSEQDRRRRHLSTTPRGKDFLKLISNDQRDRIGTALAEVGAAGTKAFLTMMRQMLDHADRDWLYPKEEHPHKVRMLRHARRMAG